MTVSVRLAAPNDVAQITAIATAAYAPYIECMGQAPAPMGADFAAHVARGEAQVLEVDSEVVAYLITYEKEAGQFVENIAVQPSRQGQGLGIRLLAFAEEEAKRQNLSRVFLYTNVRMTENLDFYGRLGYVETHRINEKGFDRIYMEKLIIS